jgi:predicted nucleic acid-binding protein
MKELDKVNSKTRVSSPSNKGFLSERDSLQKEIKEARSRFLDVIVTGDRDLLVLQEYEGIAIVTAREFWDRYFPEN